MATIKLEAGSQTSLLTTELNSLANSNASALGTEYDNATNLYMFGLFELNVTFASNPTLGSTIDLYIVSAPDGTNYDDATTGATLLTPITSFAGGFPLRNVTTAQKVALGAITQILLPPTKFKIQVYNRSSQAFPASGSTVKFTPFRYQSV